jgi:hypothetical protein
LGRRANFKVKSREGGKEGRRKTLRHKYDKMDTKDLQQIYFLNWRK